MGDSIPLPLRGWIVPVGGSTPDRHRPTGTRAGGNPRLGAPAMGLLIDCCFFCLLFTCFRVGGSFRSGVQPPTGAE